MSAPQTDNDLKCSRCEEALDTTGFPRWCKACQNKYRRELNATRKQMQETRGYAAGVSAMRAHLVKLFNDIRGGGTFTTAEVAYYIQQCRGPFDDAKPAKLERAGEGPAGSVGRVPASGENAGDAQSDRV